MYTLHNLVLGREREGGREEGRKEGKEGEGGRERGKKGGRKRWDEVKIQCQTVPGPLTVSSLLLGTRQMQAVPKLVSRGCMHLRQHKFSYPDYNGNIRLRISFLYTE